MSPDRISRAFSSLFDVIFTTFWGPRALFHVMLVTFRGPGAPFGFSGRPCESRATKCISFLRLWATFCWQGSPRRGPETPTVTKSPPKGLPQSSQKQENETNRKTQDLDFRRPYQGLATLTPFWGALNDKKLPKKHATKTTTTRNRKKTQVEGI